MKLVKNWRRKNNRKGKVKKDNKKRKKCTKMTKTNEK